MDIKPLKWKQERKSRYYNYWKAITPVSEYTISGFLTDDGEWVITCMSFQNGLDHGMSVCQEKKFDSVDDAKAYAEKAHLKHVAKLLKRLVAR